MPYRVKVEPTAKDKEFVTLTVMLVIADVFLQRPTIASTPRPALLALVNTVL
jgi:hypothetical protein